MHAEDSIRGAVTKAVHEWANPGAGSSIADHEWMEDIQALIEGVLAKIVASDFHRDVRTLRWKNKLLGKASGKQAQKIYDLRCQLVEARSLIRVDPTGYRSMRDQLADARHQVVEQHAEIRKLQLANRDLEDTARLGRNPHTAEKLGRAETNGHAMAQTIRGLV